jgi:hypothetical protein
MWFQYSVVFLMGGCAGFFAAVVWMNR